MFKYSVVVILLLVISVISSSYASAANEIVFSERVKSYPIADTMAVLADPEKKYTIEDMSNDALASTFVPADGQTSYGYNAAVYWIRFTLNNQSKFENWVVQLSNPFFDRVSFYSPMPDGSFAESTAVVNGETYSKEMDHRFFIFNTTLPYDESRTFYIRAETNSYTMTLPITLIEKNYFEQKAMLEMLLIGGYYGLMIGMLFHNLFLFFSLRIRGYLFYVLYVLAIVVLQFFWLGHGFQYLHVLYAYFPNSILSTLGNLSFMLGLLFMMSILEPKQYSLALHRVLQLLTAATIFVFVLSFLVSGDSSIASVLIFHPIVMFGFILYSSIYCWMKGSRQAKYLLFGWLILMVGSGGSLMMSFGLLPEGLFTTYGMMMATAIEIVLFSLALADRVQMLRQQHDQAQMNVLATERRFAEDLQKTVEERTQELKSSNKRLIETEQERRRLLTNISHDLRTPLTLVQGILETLSSQMIKDTPSIQKYSEIAYNRVLGINRLIEDLTELSHLEVRRIPFHYRHMTVADLEGRLQPVFREEAELAGLSFESSIEEQVREQTVHIDMDRMKQVFDNLLSNSLKHTAPGGKIKLTITGGEEHVLITLSDTGTGIAENDLPYIFERFYKGNHEQEGMGVGLSIVKEIIEQHDGEIAAVRLQQGTAFTLRLPVVPQSGTPSL